MEGIRIDNRLFLLTLGHFLSNPPAHGGDLPLQIPHSRFPGVRGDDGGKRIILKFYPFLRKAVLTELFRNEKLLRDHEFLVFGISRQLKYLHPIPKGLVNCLQDISGGDEHHFGKVEPYVDVVVRERKVLFGIQNLQEGG